jgi:hypothetical protein
MTTSKDETEVWEIQIRGTIWTRVRNPEVPGTWKTIRANGTRGPKRITITASERQHNQELIPEENAHLDPFTNGSLRCVAGSPKDIKTWLTDEDLSAIIGLEDDALFEEEVTSISMELTLRRLLDLAERAATVPRHAFVRDLVQERYAVGGTQRSVQEMIDAGEALSGFRMS